MSTAVRRWIAQPAAAGLAVTAACWAAADFWGGAYGHAARDLVGLLGCVLWLEWLDPDWLD